MTTVRFEPGTDDTESGIVDTEPESKPYERFRVPIPFCGLSQRVIQALQSSGPLLSTLNNQLRKPYSERDDFSEVIIQARLGLTIFGHGRTYPFFFSTYLLRLFRPTDSSGLMILTRSNLVQAPWSSIDSKVASMLAGSLHDFTILVCTYSSFTRLRHWFHLPFTTGFTFLRLPFTTDFTFLLRRLCLPSPSSSRAALPKQKSKKVIL
nr:hypothetical protein Iba_chr14cCG6210 [Ipomoea batatas]